MKKFITNVIFFLIGLMVVMPIAFSVISINLNESFYDKNAVFIWGDSQANRGIHLTELKKKLNKNIYSSCHDGASVYDFLVFTEQVTKNSEVIVAVSKLAQIRRKDYDYNASGLSIWALFKLYQNNYSFNEVLKVLKKNLKPKQNIKTNHRVPRFKETMEIDLPISHFESYYNKIPSFLEDKQSLYLSGIKNLIQKNCKISFIEFPYHPKLAKIEEKSPIWPKAEAFKGDILSLFEESRMDTIKLDNNRNVFKDLSHLNFAGALDLSKKLGAKIRVQRVPTIYVIL